MSSFIVCSMLSTLEWLPGSHVYLSVASCAVTDGRIVRTNAGTGGNGTAFVPCASGSGGSARRTVQISKCSRPTCTGTAFSPAKKKKHNDVDDAHARQQQQTTIHHRAVPASTCVRPFVGFEVRALGVDFFASFEIALVHFAPPQAVGEIAD